MYLCEALGYRVLVDDIRINDYSSTPLINFSWANRITEPHFGIGVNAIVSAKWFSEKLTKPSASVKIFQRNQNSQIENALQLNALACLQVVLEEKGLVQSGQEWDAYVKTEAERSSKTIPDSKTEKIVIGRTSVSGRKPANRVTIKIDRCAIGLFFQDPEYQPLAIWQIGFGIADYAVYAFGDREFAEVLEIIHNQRMAIQDSYSLLGTISVATITEKTEDCLITEYLSFDPSAGKLVLGNANAALAVALSAPLYAKFFASAENGLVSSRVCWNRDSELNEEQRIVFPLFSVQLGIDVRAKYHLNLELMSDFGKVDGIHEMRDICVSFLDEPRIIARIDKISCG